MTTKIPVGLPQKLFAHSANDRRATRKLRFDKALGESFGWFDFSAHLIGALGSGLLNVRHQLTNTRMEPQGSDGAFQSREGKAPPAPKTTNTRINPRGSDGASALPACGLTAGRLQAKRDGLLKRGSPDEAFQSREGKAPPAPKTTNARINPRGSDGASALPDARSTSKARTEHRPSRRVD